MSRSENAMARDGEFLMQYFPNGPLGSVARETELGRIVGLCRVKVNSGSWLNNGDNDNGDEREIYWKPWALLLNIHGQKYTIGGTDSTTPREELGQHIYWAGGIRETQIKKGSKSYKSPVCQIQVNQNKFWIAPLGPTPIYISRGSGDAYVEVEERTELRFGDYLCLEDGKNCYRDRNYTPRVLAFRAREIKNLQTKIVDEVSPVRPKRKRRTQKEMETSFIVGQNPLVLSHVLSYLPISSLKTARLVSPTWNDEATKLINKKCNVFFNFDGRQAYHTPIIAMKFFQYFHEIGRNQLKNWKISLPDLGTSDNWTRLNCSPGHQGATLLSDFDWFLSKNHIVRTLKLEGSVESQLDFGLRIKILIKLAPTLEDLNLTGRWYINRKLSKTFEFPSTLTFPKLRRFTMWASLQNENCHFLDANHRSMDWLPKLVQSIRKVREMHLYFYETSETILSAFLENLHSFPKLEEISVNEATPTILNLLLRFHNPIKKLSLESVLAATENGCPELEELLRKHSSSLESLHIMLKSWLSHDPDRDLNNIPQDGQRIEFPSLPRLKDLAFTIGVDGDYHRYKHDRNEMVVAFPPPLDHPHQIGIIYENHLPRLQSLTLSPLRESRGKMSGIPVRDIERHWEKYYHFYKLFLPKLEKGGTQKPCKTLRRLDIQYKDEAGYIFPRASEVAELFPGVNSQWLNKVRVSDAVSLDRSNAQNCFAVEPPSGHVMILRPRTPRAHGKENPLAKDNPNKRRRLN